MQQINTSPTKPGEWTLAQIQEALSRKIPENILKTLLKDLGVQDVH